MEGIQQNIFDMCNSNIKKDNDTLTSDEESIMEKINRRRRQILVHSCIYYRMNTNLISDAQFDKWAYELVDLQKEYPEIAKQCVFNDAFKTFDGTTGFDLPLDNFRVIGVASRLLAYEERLSTKS